MGLFGKKNKDDYFKAQLEKEALEKLNDNEDFDYILPIEGSEILSGFSPIGKSSIQAKSVITPDEIMGGKAPLVKTVPETKVTHITEEKIPMEKAEKQNSADFLYSLMTESRKSSAEGVVKSTEENPAAVPTPTPAPKQMPIITETVVTPEPKTEDPKPTEKSLDFESLFKDLHAQTEKYSKINAQYEETHKGTVKTEEMSATSVKEDFEEEIIPTIPTDKAEYQKSETEPISDMEKERRSLLDRCNAYLSDDSSPEVAKTVDSNYKLESVESILKNLEQKATERSKTIYLTQSDLDSITHKPETPNEATPVVEEEIIPTESTENIEDTLKITKTFAAVSEETVKRHFIPTTDLTPKSAEVTIGTQIFDSIVEKPVENGEEIDDTADIFSSSEKEVEEISEVGPFDYNGVGDRARVGSKLKKLFTLSTVKTVLTILLFIVSVFMLTPFAKQIFGSIKIYHSIYLALALLGALINLDIFKSFIDLIKGKHNTDLPFVLSSISTIAFTAIQLSGGLETFSLVPLSLLSVSANAVAKSTKNKRIYKNFRLLANEKSKNAITILSNPAVAKSIVGKHIDGSSIICYGKKTKTVTDFVKAGFCVDPNAKKIVNLTLICGAAGLVIALIRLILGGTFAEFLSLLTIIYCVVAAPSVISLTDSAINSASKRLGSYGAMISGYSAAYALDHCNALATDAKDLFPNGTIRLVDMKALSDTSVYQAILDAIALTENIGSPLAEMFKQAMDAPSDKPLEVDSAVYEDKMGISGWVNDRRVFIGNRILMESHGFTNIPEIELDKKIMRKGYFPVYLACDNRPCVLFVVKYFADDEIMYELKRLCNTGTTVFVKNCDPNISDDMLTDYFGLYKDSIHVMTRQGADQFTLISEETKSQSAGAVSTSSVCGLFASLTASIGIRKLSKVLYVLYTVCTVLGILAATLLTFAGILNGISPFILLLAQLGLTVITFVPLLFGRP